jgi:hypothetical protein
VNQHSVVPLCSAEELRRMYCDQNMSQIEIAKHFGVSLRKVQGDIRRAGITPRVAAKRNQVGPANARWKGSDAGYQALHLRVASMRGTPSRCEDCGVEESPTGYEWANLTGNYDDVSDYRRLCRSCHRKFDRTILNIQRSGRVSVQKSPVASKPCQQCRGAIHAGHSPSRYRKVRFCSVQCANAAMSIHEKSKSCACCGKTYEPKPSHRNRSRDCSPECAAARFAA